MGFEQWGEQAAHVAQQVRVDHAERHGPIEAEVERETAEIEARIAAAESIYHLAPNGVHHHPGAPQDCSDERCWEGDE